MDKLREILTRHAEWIAAGMPNDDPRRANLSVADLIETNLSGADLSRANLSGADLRRANLSGANLSGANLIRITLCLATLDGANLREQDIGGPGHILYALTDDEAALIEGRRRKQ